MRRGHGERGGGFGGDGNGGSAAETSGLDYYDERPTKALETARREAVFESLNLDIIEVGSEYCMGTRRAATVDYGSRFNRQRERNK